jgi:transposase
MARTSRLENSDFAREVAEAYVSGMSRSEMAARFDAHPDTITAWKRDMRVRTIAKQLHEDRIMEMTRKVDAEMQARLNSHKIKEMDDETLIKFRKELLGDKKTIELSGAIDTGAAKGDLWKSLDEDPALAAKLVTLLAGEDDE